MNDVTDEELSAFLDGALSPGDRARVDRALEERPDLRRERDRLVRLRSLVKALPAPEAPADLYARAMEKARRPRRVWMVATPSLAAAAAAALVMVWAVRDAPRKLKSISADAPAGSLSLEGTPEEEMVLKGVRLAGEVAKGRERRVENASLSQSPARARIEGNVGPSAARRETSSREMRLSSDGEQLPAADLSASKTRRAAQDRIPMPMVDKASPPGFRRDRATPAKMISGAGASLPEPEGPLEKKSAAAPGEWRGDFSGITASRTVTVRTESAWRSLWAEHASGKPAPAVNFSKDMAVGVFLGERGSSGYDVEIADVRETGGALQVSFRESRPRTGLTYLTVMTQPFHLKVVPRSDRPVRFKNIN